MDAHRVKSSREYIDYIRNPATELHVILTFTHQSICHELAYQAQQAQKRNTQKAVKQFLVTVARVEPGQ